MKKKLFTLMTLLLCLCSTAWADEITINRFVISGTNILPVNTTSGSMWYCDEITFDLTDTDSPSQSGGQLVLGDGKKCKITANDGAVMTKIVVVWNSANANATVSPGELTLSNSNKTTTWEGNASAVTFTSGNSNRIVSATITYSNANPLSTVSKTTLTDFIRAYQQSNEAALACTKDPVAPGVNVKGAFDSNVKLNYHATTDGVTTNAMVIKSPKTLSSIEFTWSTAPTNLGVSTGSYDSKTKTWTAAENTSPKEVIFYNRGTAKCNFSKIVVNLVSDKSDVNLSFDSSTSGSADIADGRTAFTLPVLTSDPNVAAITDNISYSSSEPSVAEINESTGAITLKKAGTTTITASFDGDDNYNAASTTYELTVTNSTDFEVDLRNESGGSFDIAADGTHVAAGTGVVSLTMTGYNGADHGWNPGTTITVPVTGPTKISLGTCKFGNGAVTVKNSSNETVLSFSTNDGTCYHSNTTNNVISRYYDGAATTLTISVNNYLPYVKVSSVGLDEVEYPVTFDISGASADALSAAPATAMVQRAGNYTIPANSTIYKEGNTLTGWNDGTTTYNIGAAIENVTSAKTLTPVFTENTKSLNGHTQEVTLSWPFGKGNGAPVLDYYDATGLYVIQADVDGEEIDVKMEVDATAQLGTYKAMLRNINRADNDVWAQIVEGLKLTVPSESGATVALTAYGNISTSTIDGSTEYTGTGTTSVSKEITSTTETVDVVLMDGGGYFSYLTVTMPAPPTCETPTITPATFNTDDQEVTISCATDGATIYYTTDGTDPTTTSDVYDADNKPTISSTTTFKAYAVKAGAFDSEVATATVTRTTQVVKTWDFTNWSSATQTGVKGDNTNWSQYEKSDSKGINYGENGRSNINSISSGSSLQYSSTNITETDGLTFAAGAYGLGLIFNMGKATVSSTEYTYHGSSYLWLYSNGSKITIPNVLAGATIEIATESHNGGTARYVSLSGVDNIVQTQGATEGNLAKAYQVCKWSIPAAGDILITPSAGLHIYYIKVTQDVPTVPATVQSYGWATYIPTRNVEFADGDAYVVTDINTSTGATTVAPVTQVPANTPVLLKGEGTKTIAIINTTPAAPSKNLMEVYDGSDKGTKVPYVLAKNGETAGFKKWTGAASVIKDRAVMWLDSAIALSREFFFLDGETTGISNVDVNANANFDANAPMYNLAGQKVSKSYKGIVIVNGKKVLKK